jgi:hypothetical protein
MIEYIVGFILLGYFILILVGLGFVTHGIFNLSNDTVPKEEQDAVLKKYVESKPITATYTAVMKTEELAALPKVTIHEPTGKIIYTLGKNETMVGKITIVSLWIFIIIALLGLIFAAI